jgi:hypothetical protein
LRATYGRQEADQDDEYPQTPPIVNHVAILTAAPQVASESERQNAVITSQYLEINRQ